MKLRSRTNLTSNLTIVLLLSIGLGAGTLLYTALDRLLLHPLPVAHPETLVRIVERHPPILNAQNFTYNTYTSVRQLHSLQDSAIEGEIYSTISKDGRTEPALLHMVSGSYFSLLGVQPALGRTLTPADEKQGSEATPILLSDRLWRRAFAAQPSALGSTLLVHGHPCVVVGVLPATFFGTNLDSIPDLYVPLSAQPFVTLKPLDDVRPDLEFAILGRIRPGTSLSQAQSEFATIYPAIRHAEGWQDDDSHVQGALVPIAEGTFALRDQFSKALTLLLWGLAALLLMVAANVAGLLLAQATRRRRDTAVRLALGASRRTLVLSALTHSTLLGVAGAIGCVLIANLCAPALTHLLPQGRSTLPISLLPSIQFDALAASAAILVSLIFGLVPALLSSGIAPQEALRGGSATARPGLVSRALLSLQTAATLVLLVGTGLVLHTFYILEHTSPGFDTTHLIAFTIEGVLDRTDVIKLSPSFAPQLIDRVRAIPGVRNASLASAALMQRIGIKSTMGLPGQKLRSEDFLNVSLNSGSPTFFDTLGIPILAGRALTEDDNEGPRPVPTIVNQAFVRKFFPNQDPTGHAFGSGEPGSTATPVFLIVGVVGDSKYRSLRESLLPIVYTAMGKPSGWNPSFLLYVRTDERVAPATITRATTQALTALAPGLTVANVATMQQQLDESLWQERLLAVLATVFAVLSILMAATGLYGLLAYDASQRTREFAIRNALGAQRRDVARLILANLAQIVLPGLAAGAVICYLCASFVASILYGIQPFDPLSITAALATVLLIGTAAAWQPIRRSINTDPALVLRDE